MRCLIRIFVCPVLLLSPAGAGAVMVDADAGYSYSSLAMVEGRPAMAWFNAASSELKYARALDAAGTAWGPPAIVAAAKEDDALAYKVCLRVVGGNPAICYIDQQMGQMTFIRAADAAGSVWGTPVVAGTLTETFQGFYFYGIAMEVVDGKPAICAANVSSIRYFRATDATGSSWAAPMDVETEINPGLYGQYSVDMEVIADRPAIIYTHDLKMWYRRALDAAGTVWGARVPVSDVQADVQEQGYLEIFISLQAVNGRPAIAYLNGNGDTLGNRRRLSYVRAADAAGTAWNAPVVVKDFGWYAAYATLAVIRGKPAISCFSLSGLNYVEALDADGATAETWGSPVVVVSDEVGSLRSMLDLHGRPALSFYNRGMNFLRAPDGGGESTRWPPPLYMFVAETPFIHIQSGSAKSFGIVPVGTAKQLSWTLTNPESGSFPLTGVRALIEGPDAAEFSVTVPPPAELGTPASTTLEVEYAPLTPGRKSATLVLVSDTEGAARPFQLTLTGDSVPDISVEYPPGTPVGDGVELRTAITPPHIPKDVVFTVRNPGGAELNGFGVTLDGPDAGEFSVASAPSPVPPGGATTFVLRHVSATGGRKTVSVHLTSNVAGTMNPFDLTLRMVPGTVDPSFHPEVSRVYCVAVQGNGRILAGGRGFVTAWNAVGTPDLTFFQPSISSALPPDIIGISDNIVQRIVVQKDGKILIFGTFSRVGGEARQGVARLHADGSLDQSFAVAVPGDPQPWNGDIRVFPVAIQPDGKLLVRMWDGDNQMSLSRLNSDGSLDAGFTVSGDVWDCALLPDGKILAGIPGVGLQRLSSDGNSDGPPFAPELVQSSFWPQPDGRVVLTVYNGEASPPKILRLFPNGQRDPSLDLACNGWLSGLLLQADGKWLVSGGFTEIGGVAGQGLLRIDAAGTVDAGFRPDAWQPTDMALQADGRLILGSRLSHIISPDFPAGVRRLDNETASSVLERDGLSRVRWMRGGSAPEVRDVTFDLKSPGASDWQRLGTAAYVPGGWELSGLILPPAGTLRAQAYAGFSVMEAVMSWSVPLENWRMQYFHTPDNTGDAADDADPDNDGLTNFTEFAFGLDPVDHASHALPEFKYSGGSFAASFTAPEGREALAWRAEWSPTMKPGTWTAIPDTGTAPTHVFSAPAGGERVFVRYVVKMR